MVEDPYKKLMKQTINYVIPQHPEHKPTHADGTMQYIILETNRLYEADLKEFDSWNEVGATLKQQLLAAVKPTYLSVLEDDEMGFAKVEAIDILDHVINKYGNVDKKDIENNRNRLSEAWDPNTLIEDLWTKIKTVQHFAQNIAKEEIPDLSLIHI